MAEVKWIKIVTDIFDDEKILLIESLPSADTIIVIWFKLLCICGKNNNSGVLMVNDKLPYTDEMLSTILRRDINIVRLALNTFENLGMIEIINDTVTIPNWSKYQTLDQLENRKEYMKNYMQVYREKQKLIASGECKVNSKVNSKPNSKSNVNSLDIDIDKNKSKNKNKNIYSADETYLSVINSYTDNDDLKQALQNYVEMRKKKDKGFTTKALEFNLNKLSNLSSDVHTQIEIVNQSVMNTWKGFFPLKEESYKQQSKSGNVFMDMLESGEYNND